MDLFFQPVNIKSLPRVRHCKVQSKRDTACLGRTQRPEIQTWSHVSLGKVKCSSCVRTEQGLALGRGLQVFFTEILRVGSPGQCAGYGDKEKMGEAPDRRTTICKIHHFIFKNCKGGLAKPEPQTARALGVRSPS